MAGKNTYFISDLHLGAKYIQNPGWLEKIICRFLDEIASDAQQIFLLGDILDYWFEYKYVVPKGFVRFLGKIAQLADSGVKITWIIGNHDIWIFDYLPSELGISVIDGHIIKEIYGQKFYLAHGDGLGINSIGFRFMRTLFRNKVCQKLFSGIHPRWTIPFAHSWSSSSRKGHSDYTSSKKTQTSLQSLEKYCRNLLISQPDINHFIFGHLHIISKITLSTTSDISVIGDWINNFSYAVFDGVSLSIRRCPDSILNSCK